MIKGETAKKIFSKMTEKEFVHRYETCGKSDRALAKELEVSRAGLNHLYKTLTTPYRTYKKNCITCGKTFEFKSKSYRVNRKTCDDCKKDRMRKVNHKYIKGKPSHRRIDKSKESGKLKRSLTDTNFEIHSDQTNLQETDIRLLCKCGNCVVLPTKLLLRPRRSKKLSCGCEKSFAQKEIADFTKELLGETFVKINRRPKFMEGKEVDIFIPSKKFAIEFHGLAHHSERPVYGPKDLYWVKNHIKEKYKLAEASGISLLQIYEDEWRDKKDIVKSIIKYKLNLPEKRIYARKCKVLEISNESQKEFFAKSHISGGVPAKKAFGLFYGDDLVSAISFRVPFTKNKERTLEICRFSNKLGYSIPGGFTKLLSRAKQWAKEEGFEKLISYSDLRFGKGEVYLKSGFKLEKYNRPGYFYEQAGVREGRFKHRKSNNLPGKTEREQQNNLGWYAIYDAGHVLYTLNI